MTGNDSGFFCSRPILHNVQKSNCIWTAGLEGRILQFPSAHQGGKLVGKGSTNVAMTYQGISPNGGQVAAISTNNGFVLGIMDHPERPFGNKDGQLIFRNAISAI